MLKRLLVLGFTLISSAICAQYHFDIEMSHPGEVYGLGAVDLEQLADSGYMILSSTGSSSYDSAVVTRTDQMGNIIWSNVYKGSGMGIGLGYLVKSDPTKYYLIVGSLVTLIDTSGAVVWSKSCSQMINYVTHTQQGELVCANTVTHSSGDYRIGVFKLDNTGTVLWATVIDSMVNDGVRGITTVPLSDGTEEYIVIGKCYMEYGQLNVASCISESGLLMWNKLIDPNLNFQAIETAEDSAVYIIGNHGNPISGFILKIKHNGTISFVKDIGAGGSLSMSCGSYIHLYNSGGTTLFNCAIDTGGNVLWAKNNSYTGLDISAYAHVHSNDGGIAITGVGCVNTNPTTCNMHLMKIDSAGNSGCNQQNTSVSLTNISITETTDYFQHPMAITFSNFSLSESLFPIDGTYYCGISDYSNTTVPIEQPVLFPSPANNSFAIRCDGINSAQVTIRNSLGQTVFVQHDYSYGQDVDCSSLNNGAYLILIDNVVLSQRLIIAR